MKMNLSIDNQILFLFLLNIVTVLLLPIIRTYAD